MWFLDVDGVLNTWDTPHPRHGTYRVVQILVGRRLLRVEYSPSIVARINTMHTTGLVEVVWLTSWNEHARTALAPMIGLLDFAVVSRPRPGSTRWSTLPGTGVTWWKVGRILEYLAAQPDRPTSGPTTGSPSTTGSPCAALAAHPPC